MTTTKSFFNSFFFSCRHFGRHMCAHSCLLLFDSIKSSMKTKLNRRNNNRSRTLVDGRGYTRSKNDFLSPSPLWLIIFQSESVEKATFIMIQSMYFECATRKGDLINSTVFLTIAGILIDRHTIFDLQNSVILSSIMERTGACLLCKKENLIRISHEVVVIFFIWKKKLRQVLRAGFYFIAIQFDVDNK